MRFKKWVLAVLSVATFSSAMALAACTPDTPEPPQIGDEEGWYRFYADNDEQYIVLNGIGGYSSSLGLSSNNVGSYVLENGALRFSGITNENDAFTAVIEGDVLIVSYQNTEMYFYKQISHKVEFDTMGGSAIDAITVTNGRSLAKPSDPVRDGYTFLGWYTDSEFKTPFIFNSQLITSDVKLYAYWAKYSVGQEEYIIDFDLGYEEAESIAAIQTIGGKLYNIPTPAARSGYTFDGWWISMYHDGEKLSYRYEDGAVLSENTTLYALWTKSEGTKLSAPVVEITGSGIRWNGVAGASSYQVTITGPEQYSGTVGATTLAFPFDSYAAGDYEISVTAVASNTANNSDAAKRFYKNKALANVSKFEVVEPSVLSFAAVENAQRYFITVDCGDDEHNHTEYALGKSTFFNFANCAMQEGGICFTVRAEADGYASSQSKTFVYNRALAKIEAFDFNEETETLSWDAIPDAVSYVVTVACGDDVQTIDIGNRTKFCLKEYAPVEGGILVSVYPKTKGYNSPAVTSYTYKKATLATPTNFKIDGTTLTWVGDEKAASYEIKIGDTVYQAGKDAIFDLSDIRFDINKDYALSIRAIGSANSLWSDPIDIRYQSFAEGLSYENGVLSWKHIVGADGYEVRVNGGEAFKIEDGKNFTEIVFDRAGTNKVEVRYYAGEELKSAWISIDVTAFKVTFDSRGGTAIDAQYYAYGDKIAYPDAPEKTGYNFVAWYNTPQGPASNGAKYDDEHFNETCEIVLYAYYSPKPYQLTYDLQGGECDAEFGIARYNENYRLAVPTNSDATKTFGGWYTSIGGTGMQLTDDQGNSIAPWAYTEDMKIYAFWQNDALKFTLTSIRGYSSKVYGVSAGRRIALVTEITIPTTYQGVPVMMIESGAFSGCTNLTSINIPDTIRVISEGKPFQGCTSLKAINVYATTGEDGKPNRMVRYWSSNGVLYDYGSFDDRPEGTAATSELKFVPLAISGSYTIPESVSTINSEAFANSQITEIVIASTITRIGPDAFYKCANLTSVKFAASSENLPLTIDSRAFRSCKLLTQITLPARLESIALAKYALGTNSGTPAAPGYYTASSNTGVTDAFLDCSNLESVNIEEGNKLYKSSNGMLLDSTGRTIVYVPKMCAAISGDYTIASGITAIADGAFLYCKGMTSLTIPNVVTSIGEASFANCSDLKKVTFAGNGFSEVKVGRYAFRNCYYMTELVFEQGSQVSELGFGAFYAASALESLTIPASMKTIDDQAFLRCTKLSSVEFALNGKELAFGSDVFYNCTALKTFYLPANITSLPGVFGGCTSLEEVIVDPENEHFTSIDGILFDKNVVDGVNKPTQILFFPLGRGGTYEIPSGIERIENGIFKANEVLQTIKIPNTVTYIGSEAFRNCTGLEKIIFEEGGTKEITIDSYAFAFCSSVSTLDIPARVKTIGSNAFYEMNSMHSVTLHDGLETIDEYAFYSSDRLASIAIPKTVKTIGKNAFSYCAALTRITFAKDAQLETIGISAFTSAPISSITIPKSVKTIGISAFSGSESSRGKLESITFEDGSQLEKIGGRAFMYNDNLKSICIPGNVKTIGPGAFKYCNALTKVDFEESNVPLEIGEFDAEFNEIAYPFSSISAGYEYLNYGAFYGCGFTNFVVPARVVTLGPGTFANCKSLKSITFEKDAEGKSHLAYLGDHCFTSCSMLESIVIPNSVRNLASTNSRFNRMAIGEGLFSECTLLKSVIFEEGAADDAVSTVGEKAFYNCKNLTKLILPGNLGVYTNKDGKECDPFAGDSIFDNCDALDSIEIAKGNGEYASHNGIVYSSDYSKLVYCPIPYSGEVVIRKETTSIADKAFHNCKYITAVHFEDGSELTTIGKEAFVNCSALTEIILPTKLSGFDSSVFKGCPDINILVAEGSEKYSSENGIIFEKRKESRALIYYPATRQDASYTVPSDVVEIGANAFYENEYIKSITLPSGLLKIGLRAFRGCENLKDIQIPNTVTLIDNEAFYQCYDANITFEAGGTQPLDIGSGGDTDYSRVFSYVGSGYDLVLPERTRMISHHCFQFSRYKSVSIPASVTEIKSKAFYGSSVYNIVIADNSQLTTLGAEAFSGSSNLKTFTFGKNSILETIPAGAFYNCKSLESFVLPASVKTLAGGTSTMSNRSAPFYQCSSLKSFTIENGSTIATFPNYMFSGCSSLEEFAIPSTLTKIGNYMFQKCSSLKKVTIPKEIAEIGTYLFSECSSLETFGLEGSVVEGKIIIPNTLTKIGNYMFHKCSSITDVDLSGLNSSFKALPNYMFAYCSSLEKVNVPTTITAYGTYTFQNCTSLKDFTIPANITKLDNYVFSGCTSLTEMAIPATVKTLGTYLFKDCTNLTKIDLSNLNTSITALPNAIFTGCSNLSTIELPGQINKLGTYAFEKTALKEFTIPTAVTELPNNLFNGCVELEQVTLHNGITKIGNNVFSGCVSLNVIKVGEEETPVGTYKIPESVKSIGTNVFKECSSLKRIEIPDSVTVLGSDSISYTSSTNVFQDCVSLEYVKLSAGLKVIPNYAFDGCISLKEVIIPEGVTHLGTSMAIQTASYAAGGKVFLGCTALETIELPNSLVSIGSYAFQGSGITSIVLPNEVATIGAYAFSECPALESVFMPEGGKYTEITASLFENSVNLKTVSMAEGVVVIGENAFHNTPLLNTMEFPTSVLTIGSNAFAGSGITSADLSRTSIVEISKNVFDGCANLKTVLFPISLTKISDYAFCNCKLLETIELPDSLVTLGNNPFYGCSALSDYVISAENTAFRYEDKVLYNSDKTKILSVLSGKTGSFTIPEGMTVGNAAFAGSSLSEIVISEDVVIEEHAFENSAITTITLPDSMTEIPDYTFCNSAIETIVIKNTVTLIGKHAFDGSHLKSIVFEDGGSEALAFDEYAFANCEQLTSITVPSRVRTDYNAPFNAVRAIEDYAFYQCTNLVNVTFEETPEEGGVAGFLVMDKYAFAECRSIKKIEFPKAFGRVSGLAYPVYDYVFKNCTSLEEVVFNCPEGLEKFSIGAGVFFGCTSLKRFEIPECVSSLGAYLFEESGVEEIVIPSTVGTVSPAARFRNCKNLKKITIQNNASSITNDTFNGCEALETVILDTDAIKTIGVRAFNGCVSLKNFTVPSTVNTINEDAFAGCVSLKEIEIPAGVDVLAKNVFRGWTADQTIYICGGEDQIKDWDIGWDTDCAANIVLHAKQ